MVRNSLALVAFSVLLAVAACAPSPLYVQRGNHRGTVGEVPRDGRGEPIWDAIRTVPPPPAGPYYPPAPGIPVTGAGSDYVAPPPPPLPPPPPPAQSKRECKHWRSCR